MSSHVEVVVHFKCDVCPLETAEFRANTDAKARALAKEQGWVNLQVSILLLSTTKYIDLCPECNRVRRCILQVKSSEAGNRVRPVNTFVAACPESLEMSPGLMSLECDTEL
jgi:hypothetical protein